MEKKTFKIGNIPAVLFGRPSDKVYLFVHGQGGNAGEAEDFALTAVPSGWQVLGIDLPRHGTRAEEPTEFLPWNAVPEIKQVYEFLSKEYKHIALRATSIGAWFSMLALSDKKLEKCLFVSPILDMESLIMSMMQWAGTNESELEKKGEIATDFGQTLSWKYLCYVREHPLILSGVPINILYADKDNMTSRETVDNFVKKHGCSLAVMENGEHWFHTPEQLEVMHAWEGNNI